MITVAIIIATTQVPTTFVELAATNVEMTTTTATTIIGAAKTTATATDTARRVSKNPASGAKGYIKKTKPKGGPALVGLINDTTLRHSSNWHDPRFLSRSFTPAHARTRTHTHAHTHTHTHRRVRHTHSFHSTFLSLIFGVVTCKLFSIELLVSAFTINLPCPLFIPSCN